MFAKPQSEHQWLTQLDGIWSFDHNCDGPDGEKTQSSGTMKCRMLGGLWVICESSGGEKAVAGKPKTANGRRS
ncbi:MAG: DUF1579 family protein [Rhodopirellula sp. JB044]|uniref:DUF1579 family protein n=1 Tax=Rhodopirellula sp. JB044 TaxID=3342844 RepID=UPI00370C0BB3